MGRYHYGTKQEADYLRQLSIFKLNEWNYFDYSFKRGSVVWTSNDGTKNSISIELTNEEYEKHLRLIYTQTDYDTEEKKDFNYKIPLTTTDCYFGGQRYWFICPLYHNKIYCGRRVAVLYKGGDYFGCRHCYDLAYSSQNEDRRYKMYGLFKILDIEKQMADLEEQITTPFYNGKPTKKYKKLLKLRQQMYNVDVESITRNLHKNMLK